MIYREFEEKLEQHNTAEWAKRNIMVAEINAEFCNALHTEYLPYQNQLVADEVFSMAYSLGHSNGYSEVEIQYIDLAEFAKRIIANV